MFGYGWLTSEPIAKRVVPEESSRCRFQQYVPLLKRLHGRSRESKGRGANKRKNIYNERDTTVY